jgi:hypothetical protein
MMGRTETGRKVWCNVNWDVFKTLKPELHFSCTIFSPESKISRKSVTEP